MRVWVDIKGKFKNSRRPGDNCDPRSYPHSYVGKLLNGKEKYVHIYSAVDYSEGEKVEMDIESINERGAFEYYRHLASSPKAEPAATAEKPKIKSAFTVAVDEVAAWGEGSIVTGKIAYICDPRAVPENLRDVFQAGKVIMVTTPTVPVLIRTVPSTHLFSRCTEFEFEPERKIIKCRALSI